MRREGESIVIDPRLDQQARQTEREVSIRHRGDPRAARACIVEQGRWRLNREVRHERRSVELMVPVVLTEERDRLQLERDERQERRADRLPRAG